MRRTSADDLLLGEWACLGIVHATPTHGFAIAARLKPTGDIGRIWSLSRALTYRSLEQLTARGLVEPVGEEPGIAGGNRTILAATPAGRAEFLRWLATPVDHVRDLRSELLLKVVLATEQAIDIGPMLEAQRDRIRAIVASHDPGADRDVVEMWRHEAASAALRVLDRLGADRAG